MSGNTAPPPFTRPKLGERIRLGGVMGVVQSATDAGVIFLWDVAVKADGTRIYAKKWFLDWSKVRDLTRRKLSELTSDAEAVVIGSGNLQ